MRNYSELLSEEQRNIRNMSEYNMTEEQRTQFCQYFRDTFHVDDYCDSSIMCKHFAKYLQCMLLLDTDIESEAETIIVHALINTLKNISETFADLYAL